MDDGHWLTTIAHHAHFMLRWAKNLSKFGSVASEKSSNSQQFSHINVMGLIQMHGEANLTLPYKGQMSTYDNLFSNFGRSPVPYDLCTDLAPRHPQFWRRRFLKGLTIYGHGGHLGRPTATILAIFRSPDLRRHNMKCEQIWLSGFREEEI